MLYSYPITPRLAAVAVLLGLSAAAHAQRVAVDPSFGTAGSVNTGLAITSSPNFGFSTTGTAGVQWSGMGQTVVDAAGKILVCGNEGTQFQLRRYLPDGTPDTSFGTGGLVSTAFPNAARSGGLTVQPDGKIVVVGGMDGGPSSIGYVWAAARYLPSGALDATFGTGGLAYPANPGSTSPSELTRVVVLPSGQLFAAGAYLRNQGVRLMLFTAAGQPDASFGPGGMRGIAGLFEDLTVQPADNKLVLLTTYNSSGGSGIKVLRYLPSGQPDPSFGTNGEVVVSALPDPPSMATPPAYPHSLAVQPDGKLLLAGHYRASTGGGTDQPLLLRLNADGTPDAAFNAAARGTLNAGAGLGSGLGAVAVQPDGRIVVGGTARVWPSTNERVLLARYLPTGSLDTSFGASVTGGAYVAPTENPRLVRSLAQPAPGQLLATEVWVANSLNTVRLTRYVTGPLSTRRATAALQLQAAPMPAATELHLRYRLPAAAPVRLSLRDALGRTVRTATLGTAAAGAQETALSVAALPAGCYLLTLEAGAVHQTVRVAVAP